MAWAIIRTGDGHVLNVIAYDGTSRLDLPAGQTIVSIPGPVSPGDIWDGTTVTPVTSADERDRQNRDTIRQALEDQLVTLRKLRDGTDGLTATQRTRILGGVLVGLVRDVIGQLDNTD